MQKETHSDYQLITVATTVRKQKDRQYATNTTKERCMDCIASSRLLPAHSSLIKCVINNAFIDRHLRPRCYHLGSYFKRPKSSPERLLACNWYYCAQFTNKFKTACALRFS